MHHHQHVIRLCRCLCLSVCLSLLLSSNAAEDAAQCPPETATNTDSISDTYAIARDPETETKTRVPNLSGGHRNVTSMKQVLKYARKYPQSPLVIGLSSGDCSNCWRHEAAYAELSKRLKKRRVPFLRVDTAKSGGLAEELVPRSTRKARC